MNSSKPCESNRDRASNTKSTMGEIGDARERGYIARFDEEVSRLKKNAWLARFKLRRRQENRRTMMNASIRNSLLSNSQTDTRLCYISKWYCRTSIGTRVDVRRRMMEILAEFEYWDERPSSADTPYVHSIMLTFCRWLKMILMGYDISLIQIDDHCSLPEPSLFVHSSWLKFVRV